VSARNSLLVLRWLADYAGLMAPLPGAQPALWVGMAELFDNFLLACFILFGGISLETLVWHNGCLPTRLRNALLRITTSSGCKYRAEVRGKRAGQEKLPGTLVRCKLPSDAAAHCPDLSPLGGGADMHQASRSREPHQRGQQHQQRHGWRGWLRRRQAGCVHPQVQGHDG
jgi:hypothetical protein